MPLPDTRGRTRAAVPLAQHPEPIRPTTRTVYEWLEQTRL